MQCRLIAILLYVLESLYSIPLNSQKSAYVNLFYILFIDFCSDPSFCKFYWVYNQLWIAVASLRRLFCVHVHKFFTQNAIWVSKHAEFDGDFESSEKVAKKCMGKSYQGKSDSKGTFITVCKSFRPITFLWLFFLDFAFCDTHFEFGEKNAYVL